MSKSRRTFLKLLGQAGMLAAASTLSEKAWAFTAPRVSRARNTIRELFTWGAGTAGRLGNNLTTSQSSPVQLTGLSGSTAITAVAAGDSHSMTIRKDGTLWGFGENTAGQLGNNSTIDAKQPVREASFKTWKAVSTGTQFTVAIRNDNTLWAWGLGTSGQLGDGTSVSKSTPVQIGSGTTWSQIVCGNSHTLALRSDGTLWSWGAGAEGQIGDNAFTARNSPVQVGALTTWTKIGTAWDTSYAIRSNGTLWSWGKSDYCQVTNAVSAPMQTSSVTTWTSFSTRIDPPGGNMVGGGIGIRSDNTLWGWGGNYFGCVGDGTTINRDRPVQIGGAEWTAGAAGPWHSLGIKTDGTLWAWGRGDSGQLGNGALTHRSSPVQVGSASDWSKVAVGSRMSAAINSAGQLFVWGYGTDGALGLGNTTTISTPVRLGTATWKSIQLGADFAVAIQATDNNSLWTWGSNTNGQLGFSSAATSAPTKVGTNTWSKAIAGRSHVLAITTTGQLWGWGANGDGQLGRGTSGGTSNTPTQIGALTTWTEISASNGDSYGVRSDGTLWSWGWAAGDFPMLGNGATSSRNSPTQISGTTWSKVSAGFAGAVAQKTDGTIHGWGALLLGNVMTTHGSPVQVGSGTTWSEITGGTRHALGLFTNGTIYRWGAPLQGDLDLDEANYWITNNPTQVGTATNWSKITAGGRFNIALTTSNTAWSWGENTSGQLGLGHTTFTAAPTQISGTTWQLISAGTSHVVAKKT